MTIGISFSQGQRLEAIVITDSRASYSGRQSDSVNKVGEFSAKNYHGVVFGSGNGNLIEGIIRNLGELESSTLRDYVSAIHSAHKLRVDNSDQSYLNSNSAEIKKKASLLLPGTQLDTIRETSKQMPEEQREQFIQHQMMALQQKYDQFIEQENKAAMQNYDQFKRESSTGFIVVAFDKDKEKIRQWNINQNICQELFMDHIEIGSGFDGANMYFATNLQGIGLGTKLNTADLSFFALNAYNSSSINQGVGGTPRIINVSREGNSSLQDHQINAFVNLSGAYLSKFSEEELTHKKTREYMQAMLEGKDRIYNKIAKVLDLNVEALQTLSIPYSAWQERANQKLFNGKE